MNISDWIGAIGIIVTIVGIVVGIIGMLSLQKANQIIAANVSASTVAQGENITVINNASDAYAIMKIAKDVTQSEMVAVAERLGELQKQISTVRGDVDETPRIYVGPDAPQNAKNGDIWFAI